MRIVTLTLKNFRSHQETALDLNRFNSSESRMAPARGLPCRLRR